MHSMVKFIDNDVVMGKSESGLLGLNGPFEVNSAYTVVKCLEYIDCWMLRGSCIHGDNFYGYRSIRE
jgi:hypothetical protein